MTPALFVLRLLRFPFDLAADNFAACEKVFSDIACLVAGVEDEIEKDRRKRIKTRRSQEKLKESVVRDIESLPEGSGGHL